MTELTESRVRKIVREETADMRADIGGLKFDSTSLKTDVAVLKTDVAELKEGQMRLEVMFENFDYKMDAVIENLELGRADRRKTNQLDHRVTDLELDVRILKSKSAE